jgi:hypothetical protein
MEEYPLRPQVSRNLNDSLWDAILSSPLGKRCQERGDYDSLLINLYQKLGISVFHIVSLEAAKNLTLRHFNTGQQARLIYSFREQAKDSDSGSRSSRDRSREKSLRDRSEDRSSRDRSEERSESKSEDSSPESPGSRMSVDSRNSRSKDRPKDRSKDRPKDRSKDRPKDRSKDRPKDHNKQNGLVKSPNKGVKPQTSHDIYVPRVSSEDYPSERSERSERSESRSRSPGSE